MDSSILHPEMVLGLILLIVVSGTCGLVLHYKRRDLPAGTPWALEDKVLLAFGVLPLVVVGICGAVLTFLGRTRASKSSRPGDSDLASGAPAEIGESRGDQVIRIVEERGAEVERHLLEDATDDEVGARGAVLFALPSRGGALMDAGGGEGPTDPDEVA